MFCPCCGEKNDEGGKFCLYCGAALVENQPPLPAGIPMDSVVGFLRKVPEKLWSIPKGARKPLLAAVLALVLLLTAYGVGSAITDPKRIARAYFGAIAEENWSKAYSYLGLDRTDFISREQYVAIQEGGRDQLGEVVNFSVKERTGGSRDEEEALIRYYEIDYVVKGSAQTRQERVSLVKNGGKQLLLFDNYDVVVEGLIVPGLEIVVPIQGAEVYLDDIPVQPESTPAYGGQPVVYMVPRLFAGTHELRVESPVSETYAETLQITREDTLQVRELYLATAQQERLAQTTAESVDQLYAAAIAGQAFEALPLRCTAEPAALADLRATYGDLVSRAARDNLRSYRVTSFAGGGGYGSVEANGVYRCEISYEYAQETPARDGGSDRRTGSGRAVFQYTYEDGDWALLRIDYYN